MALWPARRDGWRWGGGAVGRTGPDQDFAVFIHGQLLAMDEFLLEILEKRIVQIKLPFEGAIGHAPSTLEHGNRLVQNLLEGHGQRPPAARLPIQPHLGDATAVVEGEVVGEVLHIRL